MAGMARSALYQGEPCRAATDKPLVCGTTEHKYLQAFIFYFWAKFHSPTPVPIRAITTAYECSSPTSTVANLNHTHVKN